MSSSYADVLGRRETILKNSTGIDFARFERGPIGFDYEALMQHVDLPIERVAEIQADSAVGNTPLIELHNITELVRRTSAPGYGARIFMKDEATNPSGSFKDRRASLSAFFAKQQGFDGMIAATSGNYGAAVASQAAHYGLAAIIIQEAFDSAGIGQPEILEKTRKCEALGAEVLQTTVGPELFSTLLRTLEETGYFNASLYTPYSIVGIETLGHEIAVQMRERVGKDPDVVLATHAGGGMVTGTARGLRKAGALSTKTVGVSVDLHGLHMASDIDFNRKSFTTGHSGFSIPFTAWPDRADVPRNAARSLRYLDELVLVTQGEVFFATELLTRVEGFERGPAGNTSLAAAIAVARGMRRDETLVVTETEYTGAGKSPVAQLAFATQNGIDIAVGPRGEDAPGTSIRFPARLDDVEVEHVDLNRVRSSYLRKLSEDAPFSADDLAFLAGDLGVDERQLTALLDQLHE